MVRINFKLIKQPNKWSCTACAFAMACGVRLEEFIKQVGHDGSEVLFPDLPEPLCRRGFATPECIRVCLNWGLTVTPIDFKPRCTPDGKNYHTLNHTNFANQMMGRFQGVIQGMGCRNYHTVGWDGTQIYDPSLGIYKLDSDNFKPEIFWLIK